MNVKIINQKENPLNSRSEVLAEVTHSGATTPSRKELMQKLAESLGVEASLIVVKHISTMFGSSTSKVEANVYMNEDDLKKIEPQYFMNRGMKEKEAKEEPKKEEKKEEKPKEEKKDDAPKEEKAEKPAEKVDEDGRGKEGREADNKEEKDK